MRNRTRTSTYTHSSSSLRGHFKNFPTSTTWSPLSLSIPATTVVYGEEFNDTEGVDGRFRPCDQAKYVLNWPSADYLYCSPPEEGFLYRFRVSSKFFNWKVNSLLTPPPTVSTDFPWSAWDADALEKMLPSMSNGFSLINFLIELKDFRRLGEAFFKRKGRLKTAILGSEGDNTSLLKAFAKKPLRSLSQAYLSYSFAWKPFVSDLINIYKALESFDKNLEEIFARAGIPQTRHYYRLFNEEDYGDADWEYVANAVPLKSHPYGPSQNGRVDVYKRQRWLVKPTYRATVRYTYNLPGYQGTKTKIKAWLDAFGVKLDPAIVWNAIPFSFIVDWVVDVGGFLRRFDKDNLGLQIQIEDYCSSLKYNLIREYGLRHDRPAFNQQPNVAGPQSNEASVLYARYTRNTSIPNVFSALKTSSLSNRELALSAALLGSKGTRSRLHGL